MGFVRSSRARGRHFHASWATRVVGRPSPRSREPSRPKHVVTPGWLARDGGSTPPASTTFCWGFGLAWAGRFVFPQKSPSQLPNPGSPSAGPVATTRDPCSPRPPDDGSQSPRRGTSTMGWDTRAPPPSLGLDLLGFDLALGPWLREPRLMFRLHLLFLAGCACFARPVLEDPVVGSPPLRLSLEETRARAAQGDPKSWACVTLSATGFPRTTARR